MLAQMCVVSLFLGLIPLTALAQGSRTQDHDKWEATFFGGGSFLGDKNCSTPVQGSSQGSSRLVGLRFGGGYLLGASITDHRSEHLGFRLNYMFSNQPISFSNLTDSAPSLGLGHSIHRFSYDILYYPIQRHPKVRPYAFVGPGISLFYVKGSSKNDASAQGINLSDPWKFTMNWGGGMNYPLGQNIAAAFQFSDSISGIPGYGLPSIGNVVSGKYVPGFRPDGLLNNWLINIGFVYQWDKN